MAPLPLPTKLTPSVQQLIEEIMAVSHQVDRQVSIYDSHGGFVARYRPDLGGFIKELGGVPCRNGLRGLGPRRCGQQVPWGMNANL